MVLCFGRQRGLVLYFLFFAFHICFWTLPLFTLFFCFLIFFSTLTLRAYFFRSATTLGLHGLRASLSFPTTPYIAHKLSLFSFLFLDFSAFFGLVILWTINYRQLYKRCDMPTLCFLCSFTYLIPTYLLR